MVRDAFAPSWWTLADADRKRGRHRDHSWPRLSVRRRCIRPSASPRADQFEAAQTLTTRHGRSTIRRSVGHPPGGGVASEKAFHVANARKAGVKPWIENA
jgi:hypothetical protein